MCEALAHRGPDGSGAWTDGEAGIGLGHRRLAIQDLSDAGAQPMCSASGRYVLTYNGEVYNFPRLRRDLEALGERFRGGSDTEVILAAVERWGLRAAVQRFVGMYAFALWDRTEHRLHLVRDRLGIKPLYYGRIAGGLVLASDLAAFRRVPGFEPEIDRESLALYFRYSCVPGTRAIYRGCAKVAPGTILSFAAPTAPPTAEEYWSALDVVLRGTRDPLSCSEEETLERVHAALQQAVDDRRIADVPVGVFLSGGIDSSVVAALMQNGSAVPVRTFSIGFREEAYDEATDARRVAAHLGTEHTELYLTPREATAAIPELSAIYTEPFADSSQLPTLLVSRLARRQVTVVLSGDGGDEVFGGYNRHVWGPQVWQAIRALPPAVRENVAAGLSSRTSEEWDRFAARWSRVLPILHMRTPGHKAHKLASLLTAHDLDELYLRVTSTWQDPSALVLGLSDDLPHARAEIDGHRGNQILGDLPVAARFMYQDLTRYLSDDILTKVDRASMSVGLEARVPLIDHRVVELAWRLPLAAKIDKRVGKRVLRHILGRYLPRQLYERPKKGFGVPIDIWLRGPLRDWAESMLDPKRIREDGWIDPAAVQRCWRGHLSGAGVHQHELWAVLMFQAWRASLR